jgi:hypothetical protein
MTPKQLAKEFAGENQNALLTPAKDHPTVGGVIELERMNEIAAAINKLAHALTLALKNSTGSARDQMLVDISDAMVIAQNFDTNGNYSLETPDELTDIMSLAAALRNFAEPTGRVQTHAKHLVELLLGVKAYGDSGIPWVDRNTEWNFSLDTLAMNIFCPDPLRKGIWDWRSPYYLQTKAEQCKAQPNIIDFLQSFAWVEFIIEYHRDTPFIRLSPVPVLSYPIYIDPTHNPDLTSKDRLRTK